MTAVRQRWMRMLWIALLQVLLMAALGFAALDAQPAATVSTAARSGNAATPEQLTQRVATLIGQLGDPNYLVRQATQSELSRIGPEAFDALTAAENDTDIEISSHAKYLVQQIRAQWIHYGNSPQVRRILDKYELLDDAGRLRALRQLSFLPRDEGLAPLCRLMRFERSPLVSKISALLVIDQPDAIARSWAARQKTIETNLAQNNGPGAKWLRAYIRFHNDPPAAAADVDKLVDGELTGLVPFANKAQRENALSLESRMVNVLEQNFNRRDRALDILQKLVPLVADDQESVSDFADLLVQHNAWQLVQQLANRAETIFNSDPILLYTWAHSLLTAGKTAEADKLSDRAFQLSGNKAEDHKDMGIQLSQRGLFDAAEREFRHVIATSPQDTQATIDAQDYLSAMLHDQEHELQAAEVLQKLADAMDKDPTVLQRVKEYGIDNSPDMKRGQMHFYYACDHAAHDKLDDQRRELDEGAKCDPTNADILIGLYDTSAKDPARRKQAMELIRAADKGFRETIALQPSEPSYYNQDAWLIGNTEGDYELAIQYSQNSIELLKNRPEELPLNEAGFLDTLAHCYAGKGDFENAVKYQARAAELDPHTLQIARALEKFRRQLEKSNPEKPSSP
jgi:tetratricopeptide (TPR) repeat protein